jgi:hypothetical protein
VVVIVLLLIVGLAVVAIPHSVPYSFSISDPGSTATYYQSQSLCPVGATAAVSFTVESGPTVTFSVLDPNGNSVWSQDSSGGSTSFTVQTCGDYKFGTYDWVGETVDVSVTLSSTSPVLRESLKRRRQRFSSAPSVKR